MPKRIMPERFVGERFANDRRGLYAKLDARIEDKLQMLLQQRIVQKSYSTGDVAKILNKAEIGRAHV